MEQARGQVFRRFGVLTVVLSGHVLLVILLSSSRPSDTHQDLVRTDPLPVLVLLDLESRSEQRAVEQTPERPTAASASRTRTDRPRKSSSTAPIEPIEEASKSTAINPGEGDDIPKIDWRREMEAAPQRVERQRSNQDARLCARPERTNAPRPPGCNRRSFDGPWRPSGNLLQDIRDPDRPRSSVPDPLPEPFPKAPRSEVFQEEK